MSNDRSNAAKQEQRPNENEALKREVASLRSAIGDLALLMLEPGMRVQCECGALACRTVHASSNALVDNSLSVEQRGFHLCEDCKLPAGWTENRRVELAPRYRETIRIANRLCSPQR